MNFLFHRKLIKSNILYTLSKKYLKYLPALKINANILRYNSQQSIYLVDETTINNENTNGSNVNKYTTRTATCGELSMDHVGQRVTLNGWLEYNRMNKFLILRDAYGQTQLIIKDEAKEIQGIVKHLNYETTLEIKGTVIARPKDMINKKQKTGEIEVAIEALNVVNKASILPFNIREYQKANEALRMQYRYLDMRFSEMQQNLRFRSEFCMNLREFLIRHCGFVDVETPTLFKATPGGAQEFVVPTKYKNKFYSLVQSPQQFKQMLMCGGIDRYFQIARCYRDETSRPDRQPEFTQLDIEMANTSMEGVMELVEELLQYAWPHDLQPIASKFCKMRYHEAIENYGTDKPDVRYEHKIINVTHLLKSNLNLHGNGDKFYAGCLVFEEGKHNIKLSNVDKENAARECPNTRMIYIKSNNIDEFKAKIGKYVNEDIVIQMLQEQLQLTGNSSSSVFLVYGDKHYSLKRLGKLRTDSAHYLHKQDINIFKEGMHFLWLVDFPLFSLNDKGELCSEHHPFTSPHLDDIILLDSNPLQIRALSYDLVLNGHEVGGGSIRIHDPKLQQKILQKLDISGLDHIVEMLSFGCPPHGGIALGLDRLFACILNTPSIRDVIAFPKTFDGKDPISGAPSFISDLCKKMYHLK